jgi:tetratricopeptide (TPR) repeat protein
MIQRVLGAAVAALLLLGVTSTADADILVLRGGAVLPKKMEGKFDPKTGPSDRDLSESGKNNSELEYGEVKCGGGQASASLLVDPYPTEAYLNAFFRNGENQGRSGYWAEAADSFGEAAEALKGSAKQVAMYKRVLCFAQLNDFDATFAAAQELLDAFPKSYYMAALQDKRARILYSRGDRKGARAALDSVITAPGMNARDYFEAKLAQVYLFQFKVAGKNKAKYAKARQEYENILREIGARGANQEAAIQRLKANVGIGKCFVYEQEYAKARPYFDRVIADPASLEDKQLLAQAYTGLGDVIYAEVKAELAKGDTQKEQLPEIQERLTDASLHYLRVAKFYVENAGDELYPATVGVARVWATQFTLSGETDCDLAQRAVKFFFEAHKLLPRGEVKRLLTSEVKRFLAKRDEACKVTEPDKGENEK